MALGVFAYRESTLTGSLRLPGVFVYLLILSLNSKDCLYSINYMPAVIFRVCFDLSNPPYPRTLFWGVFDKV